MSGFLNEIRTVKVLKVPRYHRRYLAWVSTGMAPLSEKQQMIQLKRCVVLRLTLILLLQTYTDLSRLLERNSLTSRLQKKATTKCGR